jgi:glyoxylase-like metal-dependent hydrolase (beta-lactamase superfamily II)
MNSAVITTDDLVLVADPGYLPAEINEIRDYVKTVKGDKPVFLFFTHSDFDHIVGFSAFPDAKTIASSEFVETPIRDKQLQDIIRFDDDLYINRPYKLVYPVIDHVIEYDGERLELGKTSITFHHAFGHTDDGLFAVIEPLNAVIAGDYLSDLEFPFVYYSYPEYEKTLTRFKALMMDRNKVTLIPGHGNTTNNRNEFMKRINDSAEYIQLIKEGAGDERYTRFLTEKKYRYVTNLKDRHLENQEVWKKQTLGT